VKFGLLPPYRTGVTADPAWIGTFARAAEANGFESIYVAEHVVVVAGYTSRYPYSDTGRMTLPDKADIPDPLELLSFLAGCTTRLRLGTGILVAPEHHPVQLAKRLATLDRLSNARLVAGLGVGWLKEELATMDVDPSTRGARTDECIDALRVLWRDEEATFHGRFYDFERALSFPKPTNGTIPIHIGGHSTAAARRAGRRGDGFHPLGLDDALLTTRLDELRRAAADAGRDGDAIELTLGGLLDQLDDERLAYAEKHGASRLVLSTRERDIDAATAQLESFARRFIA